MSENTMDFVTDFDTKCAEDDASEYCVALREEQGSNFNSFPCWWSL